MPQVPSGPSSCVPVSMVNGLAWVRRHPPPGASWITGVGVRRHPPPGACWITGMGGEAAPAARRMLDYWHGGLIGEKAMRAKAEARGLRAEGGEQGARGRACTHGGALS
jgi:hypothetical protein